MPGNSFGKLFKVTSFGESHGPGVGCVVDGCPPGLELAVEDIQPDLDRRKPGQSRFTSQRREPDQVKILSGIFEGKTTGTPITLYIENQDQKPKDYSTIKNKFRPGHGDYCYYKKYGNYDYRGGGRASARETVARVAAGAIAKKFLYYHCDTKIIAYVSQIGDIKADMANIADVKAKVKVTEHEGKIAEQDSKYKNKFFFPDNTKITLLEDLIYKLQREGDSIGAKLEVIANNVPVGLGDPVFNKLDASLAYALMGINAVKGVEIGAGFSCVNTKGSEFRDLIDEKGFLSNNSGGMLAGISTGQDIVASIAFKPTPSIRKPGETVDVNNKKCEIITTGRHDPCVGIRAVPIVEAMVALVLMDHFLLNRSIQWE